MVDQLAHWFLLKPYLCPSCSLRFRALPQGGNHPSLGEQLQMRLAEATKGKGGRWVRKTGCIFYLIALLLFLVGLRLLLPPQ